LECNKSLKNKYGNAFIPLRHEKTHDHSGKTSIHIRIPPSLSYSNFDEKKYEELKLLYLQLFREKKIYTNREKIQYLKLSKASQRLHELKNVIEISVNSDKVQPVNNMYDNKLTQNFEVENNNIKNMQSRNVELTENINLFKYRDFFNFAF
jgi:hypothetical protein